MAQQAQMLAQEHEAQEQAQWNQMRRAQWQMEEAQVQRWQTQPKAALKACLDQTEP